MKKMNNKGFMLTETLIVATLLITILLVVYVQFKSLNRKISNSFEYNTVSSLYNLYNVKLYVEQEKFSVMVARLDLEDYIDITSCSSLYFSSPSYCESIINGAGIKKLLMTKENIYSLIERKPFESEFNDYIASVEYSQSDGYRLIASFNDGSYSSIRVLNDEKFYDEIAGSCLLSMPKQFKINYLTTKGAILKEPFIDTAGCNSTITVSRYENNSDSCYYVNSYSTNALNISQDESLNEATIYYELYATYLTIHYKNLANEKIAIDEVIDGNCGTTYYPENYKKTISGYNYSNASVEQITLSSTSSEVTLYYGEGSGDNG